MEQRERRGSVDATVGYEAPRVGPSSAPPPPSGKVPLPAELASTIADAQAPVALDATLAAAPAAAHPASAPATRPGAGSGASEISLGATIAAPLPAIAEGSSAAPRVGATTLSVLPRVEPAGRALRLSPSDGAPRYRSLRALGEGGMGEVALVEDRDIGRTVAVKRLRDPAASVGAGSLPSSAPTTAAVARFVDEVRTTGRLEHPNIVPIHDVGVDEQGRYFFVMKYVDGETLESVIEKLRAGDPRAVAGYGMQRRIEIFVGLLRALQYAHARGIVHRDVKPANVMIGRYGEVVLMDWGVARPMGVAAPATDHAVAASEMREAPSRASETHDGALIGTPLYMSPEQAAGRNDELDARSDLYAATVVFHELLGLHHLREKKSGSLGELLLAISNDDAPAVPGMFPGHPSNPNGVPVELAHFVRRGLALEPGRRWQSADEMILELEAILEGRCRVQCPWTLTKRTIREVGLFVDRRPFVAMTTLALGAVAMLALIGNAIVTAIS